MPTPAVVYENGYLDIGTVNGPLAKKLFNRMLEEAVEKVGNDGILFGSDQIVWPQMITSTVESIRNAPFVGPGQAKHPR